MFAPRSRAVKKPYGASLNEKIRHHPFDISLYKDFLYLFLEHLRGR